jgi:tetratricopeptide (TPR) repeat protein
MNRRSVIEKLEYNLFYCIWVICPMNRIQLYTFITIIALSICAVSCASKIETHELAAPPNNALIAANISKADELARRRSETASLQKALDLLAQIRNPDNRNYEVEWKFAKYNYFLGKALGDEKQRDTAFKDGEAAGKIASRVASDKPEGHFWYGANLGEQARRAPLTKGLTSLGDIRSAMNRVIEIEPAFEGASAFDVLAQIELETRLTGGKAEKAVEYLEKAIGLEKENSYVRLHLAEAYLAVDRNAEAKKQLEFLLKMKPNPEYLPEYEESAKEAKRLLDTRF